MLININFGSRNYTSSDPPIHFVHEPTRRGTVSLATTCITTISLCVWTAVHLNIPVPGCYGSLQQKLRKVFLFCVGFLAPEVVAYTAWKQRITAEKILEHVPPDKKLPPLGKRITLWCRMVVAKLTCSVLEESKSTDPHLWTMTHAFYATMGGFVVQFADDIAGMPTEGHRYTILPDGILRLLNERPIPKPLTELSIDDINDKSKSDKLAKFLCIVQVGYFIFQCGTRFRNHLAISILEINTLGHALCALLNYFLWWDKPLNVNCATIIRNAKVKEVLLRESDTTNGQVIEPISTDDSNIIRDKIIGRLCLFVQKAYDEFVKPDEPNHILGAVMTLGLHSFLHLLAWDGSFRSPEEQFGWQVASVILMISSFFYVVQAIWSMRVEPMTWKLDCQKGESIALGLLIGVVIVLCFLARLFLVAESFWNLLYLPDEVYDVPEWTGYFPHL
ncbi:hypothetical protein HYFRA_00005382 [Hymenoscyphus fraxineus]|uniref:Uncharacterized protein n=1 Tax=Hymenoscyphus fraxineus TaxID=746836 RepID=A0A9N9LDK0_9HELO|nr:hypothetical protein HYFRA_00005382 [Hymenoscyphus fraxineus]